MASGIELATAYVSLSAETSRLAKDINKAFEEADKGSLRAGKKIGTNLGSGMGSAKNSAAKAGADAAAEYERALKAQIKGERIGEAIGRPIGKGIGLAIKGGIGLAATGAAAAVGALTVSLTKGFARLKNIDNAQFKLKALGNSAEDVKAIMDAANKSVKGTAFGLDEAATTAGTAVAAGVGKQDLAAYLTSVADAAAIAQTSMEEMGSIFNKVQTNGKAMTDDLQMLADRGLPIFTWLQKQYGVTGEALQKMVQAGKVSAADFQRAISENIGGAAQKMGQSFDGAMSNLNAAMGRFGANFINAALGGSGLAGPTAALGNITEAFDKLGAAVNRNSGNIADFFSEVGKLAIAGAQGVLQAVAEIIGAFGGLQDFIGNIHGGMTRGMAALKRLTGDTETADRLDAEADAAFAWGDSAKEAQKKIMDLVDRMDKGKDSLDKWGESAKAAQAVTNALGDSFKKVNDNGQIVVESNAMDKIAELNDLGLVVKNLPDGSFEVIPGTPEAQALVDAFVAKNSTLPPAKLPVDVDTSAAAAKLQNLYNEIFKAPANFTPPAATPGQNPLLAGPQAGGYVPYDPSAARRPRIGGGRATGGPITGPGRKGKDSILMWGAPGEHMLTDDEVDKLGGQKGAYALRAAIRAGTIPGFENGGAIGAIDYAYNAAGKPYQYGAFDCSMLASQVYARMAGLPPGRYFNTESDFEALGFKKGYKPGALNVGIRRGGGGPNSHMAVTLPNGVNAENTGPGAMYGGGAAGAGDFPLQYYYESPNSGDMGELQQQTAQGGMPGTTAAGMDPTTGQPVDPASQPSATGSGRTEGYIPAAAGASGRTGGGLAGSLLGMGAEAINGLIDQAAAAASQAVAAGVAGGTMGSGAAGAPAAAAAAQAAIGMGTQAAKRGVEYAAEMGGIGIGALTEVLSPFGAPRLLSDVDPTSFMPNAGISPAATTTAEALQSGVDPNTRQHGQAAGAPPGPVGPQANLPAPDPNQLQAQPPGLTIGSITGMNPADVSDQLLRYQRLNALQYQGRP